MNENEYNYHHDHDVGQRQIKGTKTYNCHYKKIIISSIKWICLLHSGFKNAHNTIATSGTRKYFAISAPCLADCTVWDFVHWWIPYNDL